MMQDRKTIAISQIVKIIEECRYNDELAEGYKREILDQEKVYDQMGKSYIKTISQYPKPTAITDRGDRIRTCDLVLPKHSIYEMRFINIFLLQLGFRLVVQMGLSLNLAQSTYHYILNTYAQLPLQLPLQLPPERPSVTC